MRLVNVESLELAHFKGEIVPVYAVASHRWQDDEITFKDMINGRNKKSKGYRKVAAFCNYISRAQSFPNGSKVQWLWMDTCCINKEDPHELAEAIGSMWDWYSNALFCLAHLSDVDKNNDWTTSQWFRRGWTLQELIAPPLVIFLDSGWQVCGHRQDKHHYGLSRVCGSPGPRLHLALSRMLNIPPEVLEDLPRIHDVPFWQVLSWMNTRNVTRLEDRAYCLLGLLDVSIPIVYGEKEHAEIHLLEALYARHSRRLEASRHGSADSTTGQNLESQLAMLVNRIEQLETTRRERRYGNRGQNYMHRYDRGALSAQSSNDYAAAVEELRQDDRVSVGRALHRTDTQATQPPPYEAVEKDLKPQ